MVVFHFLFEHVVNQVDECQKKQSEENFVFIFLVGQLWIVEDQEQENSLQKIELINRTLLIERTLRSKIKNVIECILMNVHLVV